LWLWIGFNACVLIVLAIDLFDFQRKVHAASAKEAGTWTLVWILLSLGLNALISRRNGHAKALKFLTCCLKLRFSLGLYLGGFAHSAHRPGASPGTFSRPLPN
jgi:hypothetical protein